MSSRLESEEERAALKQQHMRSQSKKTVYWGGSRPKSLPVSVIRDKHPLPDLSFNFLVDNQQHDSIQVESLALLEVKTRC